MPLKTIAVSSENYENLKNLGRAGESFNYVITELIRKTAFYYRILDRRNRD